jgi:hypothetical protein
VSKYLGFHNRIILKSLEDRIPRTVVVKSKLQLGFETLTYFYHVISMEVASERATCTLMDILE